MTSYHLQIASPDTVAELQQFLALHPDIHVEQWDSELDDSPENDPELIASLTVARTQIQNGEFLTREQLNQEIAKWKRTADIS